jgi:Ni/Co efflux regulator RcnB
MFKSRSAIVLLTGLALAVGSAALLAQPDQGQGGPGQSQMRVQSEGKSGAGRQAAPQREERQDRYEQRERHEQRDRYESRDQDRNREPRWLDDRREESRSGRFRVDHDRVRVVIGGHRDYWSPGPALPPGIRKNLQRGKPLPPGIDRHWLDGRLERQLPRYYGHEWVRVGNDLVLISVSTRVINDVLHDIFH